MEQRDRCVIQDCLFVWDPKKAQANLDKHNVSFHEAAEVFFDPLYRMEDVSVEGEQRFGIIGYSKQDHLLYVVSAEHGNKAWRIISARTVTTHERARYEETNDLD